MPVGWALRANGPILTGHILTFRGQAGIGAEQLQASLRPGTRIMSDVPPEVRTEFEEWLDDYIEQYRKAISRILRRGRDTPKSPAK